MSFSEQVVSDIRAQANIVDVIGDYVTLEKRGRNHFACCPFHQEATPSFSVSEEKQLFHCFGCHAGGDVFTFVMQHDGLEFQEAVRLVAKYTNVDSSLLSNQLKRTHQSPLQPYYELMKFVSEFYAYMLQTDKGTVAKSYLENRGITQKEITDFQIGFAPDEQILGELLEEKGYSIEKARELGLLFESKDMTQNYDAFRGRVVFPITDSQGHVVAFSGRVLESSANKSRPKYFHSPENLIFKKRTILYNYSFAKNEIKKAKEVYVCEGIFDVIAAAQAGVLHSVCTLGTALSEEQLQLLGRMKSSVNFVFDNDSAGKNAMLKALRLSITHKLEARAVTFWQYAEKDLAELIAVVGASGVQNVLAEKQTINDYYLRYYEDSLNLANNEDKQEFVRKMVDILQYSNQGTREHYYQIIKEKTGYSNAALGEFLTTVKTDQTQSQYRPTYDGRARGFSEHQVFQSNRTNMISGQERSEKLIIKGLIKGEAYITIYQKSPVFSQNKVFRNIIWKIIDYFTLNNDIIDFVDFNEKLARDETEFLLQAFELDEPITPQIFEALLLNLQETTARTYLKSEAKEAKNKDKAQHIAAIQQLVDFKKKLNKSEEK